MAKFFKAIKPTFPCDVQIAAPGKDADQLEMEVVYKYKTTSELTVYINASQGRTDIENLSEVIESWSGNNIPEYGPEQLKELLEMYPVASSILFQKYISESTAARAKNLKAPLSS